MRSTLLAFVLAAILPIVALSAQPGMGGQIDAKALAKTEKAYEAAKKAFKRHPSPKTKDAYIAATDRYALSSMYAVNLLPKVKYRQALHLYREVLKIDPNNHEAKNNAGMIIDIYHELHRPVPPI